MASDDTPIVPRIGSHPSDDTPAAPGRVHIRSDAYGGMLCVTPVADRATVAVLSACGSAAVIEFREGRSPDVVEALRALAAAIDADNGDGKSQV